MVPSRDKLDAAKRERADTERRAREVEAERLARAEAREREKRETIADDRERIWALIDKKLRTLLEQHGIEFDLRVWSRTPLQLQLGGGFNPDVEFVLKEVIERRSVRVSRFDRALAIRSTLDG